MEEEAISEKEALVRAYGLYWVRDTVDWKQRKFPGLRMKSKLTKVNTTEKVRRADAWSQQGIYALYSNGTLMYVGLALSSEGIGDRLYSHHTKPRLSGRWDSFSWFGFSGFDASGNKQIDRTTVTTDHNTLIRTVELALILAADPPMNRAAGKFFGAERINQDPKAMIRQPTNAEIMELLTDIKNNL